MLSNSDSNSSAVHSHPVVLCHSVRYTGSTSMSGSMPYSVYYAADGASDGDCGSIFGATKITPHNAPAVTP